MPAAFASSPPCRGMTVERRRETCRRALEELGGVAAKSPPQPRASPLGEAPRVSQHVAPRTAPLTTAAQPKGGPAFGETPMKPPPHTCQDGNGRR